MLGFQFLERVRIIASHLVRDRRQIACLMASVSQVHQVFVTYLKTKEMRKTYKVCFLLFAVASSFSSTAQEARDDVLYWDKDSLLRKEHFRSLNNVAGASAQSALNISIHHQGSSSNDSIDSLLIVIQAFFIPEDSWFLPN